MTHQDARHGLGDPRIPWVVLLDLGWTDPPGTETLARRLDDLAREAGWAAPRPGAVLPGARSALVRALASGSLEALRVGRYDDGVVLAARHDALDGLAMLTAGRRLLGEVRSLARGLPASTKAPGAGALLRRAWEVAARPPARVVAARTTTTSGPTSGDVFASTEVDTAPRTADLVLAGARAVADWNREHGRPARRTSVAVGASRVGGTADDLRDASAFLRLTDVDRMGAEEVRAALAQAPVQPGGSAAAANGIAGRLVGAGVRIAAPRLGSTLLVSHLGTLTADDALRGAAFYPVTGGGSGLSLGAATLRGSTTLTLRARAATHDDDALQHLLERVVANLD